MNTIPGVPPTGTEFVEIKVNMANIMANKDLEIFTQLAKQKI
jgi:hypothetical protein